MSVDPRIIKRELLRRKRAQESLHSYALSIQIPLAPNPPFEELDEDAFGPARLFMPQHIALMLDVLQRTVTRPMGRAMLMLPPGTAKSSYASVVLPTWVMGKVPQSRLITASYATPLAERQSRRAQQICKSPEYGMIWDNNLVVTRDAAGDWALSNESEALAAGLTAGITGNRATGWIIDDPVKGREDADSEQFQSKTIEAYQNDLLTRVLPGCWGILVMTRWSENDLAGSILPEDYAGQSGMVLCRDGLFWEIFNVPAKCEHADDPLGRKIGEYLWTEFFPKEHWQMFERGESRVAQRVWSSLYQQRPAPQGSTTLDEAKIHYDKASAFPKRNMLRVAGFSDFAVTENASADWSEHAVFGVDADGEVWLLDSWSGQVTTDKSIESLLDMAARNGVRTWFDEKGVIHNSVGPALNKRMRERRVYLDVRSQSSNADKVSKVQGFIALANTGIIHAPSMGPHKVWMEQAIMQVKSLPAGRWDDKADVLGLLGRAIDQIMDAPQSPPPRKEGIRPFSAAWVEYNEAEQKPKMKYR